MNKHLTTALLVCAIASLAGCAPVDDEENVERTSAAYTVGTNTIPLTWWGGGGGSLGQIDCSPGDVAVGLYGSSQNEVNTMALDPTPRRLVTRVGLLCAHLEASGALGPTYATNALGNQVNHWNDDPQAFRFDCSPKILVGIRGRSGRFLDAIGASCGAVRGARSDAATQVGNIQTSPFGNVQAGATTDGSGQLLYAMSTPIAGGSGGAFFSDWCPNEMVVTRLAVRSGSWVDAVQATCTGVTDIPNAPTLDGTPVPPPRVIGVINKPPASGGISFCPSCRK